MSKYIKLDDAIDSKCPCEDIWEGCINCPLQNSGIDPCKMGKWLNSLPTIEVSEDCISRAAVIAEFKKDYDDIFDLMIAIEELPSVVPTAYNLSAVEDCISREYILGEAFASDEYNRETKSFDLPVVSVRDIENAPSVVPKRAEGEWIPCTKEGLPLTELMRREGKKWYGYRCTNCNFIYKGNALTESRYCQGCGAKMKGADDE